jgi:hypothetical protein
MPGAFPVLFISLKRLIDSDAGVWRDFMYFFRALSTTVFILPYNKENLNVWPIKFFICSIDKYLWQCVSNIRSLG